jgi:hypothetical protein
MGHCGDYYDTMYIGKSSEPGIGVDKHNVAPKFRGPLDGDNKCQPLDGQDGTSDFVFEIKETCKKCTVYE